MTQVDTRHPGESGIQTTHRIAHGRERHAFSKRIPFPTAGSLTAQFLPEAWARRAAFTGGEEKAIGNPNSGFTKFIIDGFCNTASFRWPITRGSDGGTGSRVRGGVEKSLTTM